MPPSLSSCSSQMQCIWASVPHVVTQWSWLFLSRSFIIGATKIHAGEKQRAQEGSTPALNLVKTQNDTVSSAHTPLASTWPWSWPCKRVGEYGGTYAYLVNTKCLSIPNLLYLTNSNTLERFGNFTLFPLSQSDIIWEVVQNIFFLGFSFSLEFAWIPYLFLSKFDFFFFNISNICFYNANSLWDSLGTGAHK